MTNEATMALVLILLLIPKGGSGSEEMSLNSGPSRAHPYHKDYSGKK